MSSVALTFLFLGMLVGLITIPFGLPGIAILFLAVVLYAIGTHFDGAIDFHLLLVFAVLTVIAETADNWLMLVGARKFGASKAAVWLSMLGGILGAVLLGPPLALVFNLLGPFVGAFLGAFLVVVLYEYSKNRQWLEALRAGWGTVLGRMAGIVLKMLIGVAMVGCVIWSALRSGDY